jgi:hypothetical protein
VIFLMLVLMCRIQYDLYKHGLGYT